MTRYRVSCQHFTTHPLPSLEAAERKLFKIEQLGECLYLHTIQVEQSDGAWLPMHEHRAKLILAAKLNETIETVNGPLIKAYGSWSTDALQRADAAGEPASPEWQEALGPSEATVLTGDGQDARTSAWCGHKPPADTWVRYERWSPRGMEAHGYVCPDINCRQLVQSG